MDKEDLSELLKRLLSLDENEWVEYKENNSNPEDMGQYISALSNSACLHKQDYGYLVYGVNNSKIVVGTKFTKKQKKGNELIESWLNHLLNPRIDFEIYEFDYQNKKIFLFQIESAKKQPTKFNGTAWIRVCSYTKKLYDFPEKERKIWKLTSGFTFEKEIALSNVDEQKVLRLLDYPSYFHLTESPLPFNTDGIINKFIEEKIIIKKSANKYDITNLGAILFANNLNDFEGLSRKAIRVIFYKGRDKTKTIREAIFTKGYASGFQQLVQFIKQQLPENEEIKKALRKNVKMYPDEVVRELVPNALVHQDFDITGTGPTVEIFEDRIEISNGGTPLIDILRFIDHKPVSRNEKLASFMRRLHICEERGSGIDKVIHSVEYYQLPAPNFLADEDSVNIIVYFYKKLKQMSKEDKIRACYQHCAIKYVTNDLMTNESLRKRLNISKKSYPVASRIISNTIKAKLIKSQRGSRYIPFWAG